MKKNLIQTEPLKTMTMVVVPRLVARMGIVLLGLYLVGCTDKPQELKAPLGTVSRVQFVFAGWNGHTQIEAAGRSLIVEGMAPIPLSTAVELSGNKQNAVQLCVTRAQRCWPIYQPLQHDWALLGIKP